MSRFEHGDLSGGAAPATSGSVTAGRPSHYPDFDTPVDQPSQPVAAFPALAPPTMPVPAPPARRNGRGPRVVVTLPMWVLAGLGLLAVIAGLIVIPEVQGWLRPPNQTQLDDPDAGDGIVGPVVPTDGAAGPAGGGSAVGSPGQPGASGTPGEPGATAAPGSQGATGTATPTVQPTPSDTTALPSGGSSSAALTISHFSAAAQLIGYRVTIELNNPGSAARSWTNVGVVVNGLDLLPAVRQPTTGVRAFLGQSRVCVAPTTQDAAVLDPGESIVIIFDITVSTAQPGPARLDDPDGCATANS